MSDTESPPEALPTYFGVNPPVEAVAGSSAANQYQAAPDDPDFIQVCILFCIRYEYSQESPIGKRKTTFLRD